MFVRGKPGFVVGHELDTAAATPSFRVLIQARSSGSRRAARLDRDEADELRRGGGRRAPQAAKRKAAARRRAVPAPPSKRPSSVRRANRPGAGVAIRARQPVADEARRAAAAASATSFLLFPRRRAAG